MIDFGQALTVQERRDAARKGPFETKLRERIAAFIAAEQAR